MARSPQGWFQDLPFNWSRPSRDDAGRGLWDPDDPRTLTPKNVGWGYGINLAALFGRRQRDPDDPDEESSGA